MRGPFLHSANRHAVVEVVPSAHREWQKILIHPSHRHGTCTFEAFDLNDDNVCADLILFCQFKDYTCVMSYYILHMVFSIYTLKMLHMFHLIFFYTAESAMYC